jgi:hypothetical protein
MTRPDECSNYEPSELLYNGTRPDAYKMGSLWVCDPSEREIWTTSGRFKVGDAEHQPQEQREQCPGYTPETEKRKPVQEGKLDFVEDTLCPLFSKALPKGTDDKTCTAYMQKVAPSANGPNPDSCNARFYPEE